MKKLISMVDFCLEQRKTHTGDFEDYCDLICRYAKFLKQPLTLGMFVPCDLHGNVLEEKKPFQDKYYEYQEARERCLFKGFGVRNGNWLSNGNIDIDEEFCQGLSIESLVKYNLELTQKAQV